MGNERCMQSQARVSLSKRVLFHRVIPFTQSEAGIKVPAELPASLWEADSLDGGSFPSKADSTLTKSVFKVGWDSGGPAPWRQKAPFLAKGTCRVDTVTSYSQISDSSLRTNEGGLHFASGRLVTVIVSACTVNYACVSPRGLLLPFLKCLY